MEEQSILTDTTELNLSEQLRACIFLLEQVWSNLLDNAIKFSSGGGQIGVSVAWKGNRLCISIRNSGPTTAPSQQEKIFCQFDQGDESHVSEENGVAVAIVKQVAEQSSGSVRLKSEAGSTEFAVYLPA